MLIEGCAAKEGVEIQKVLYLTMQQCWQINLVEVIEFVRGVFMIESPRATIGENAPFKAAMLNVKGNLVGRVLVGERITTSAFNSHI